jgi:hypothetical protein
VKVVINACSLRDIDQSGVQTAQRSLEFGHLQGVTALQLDNMALQAAAV